MRVVVAPDKWKGCLSAPEAARAMARGIVRACPEAEIDLAPMADGGEGTVEALVEATDGDYEPATVAGPLGAQIASFYGRLGEGFPNTAVVAMSTASGLVLLPPELRDPTRTTTRGTGELILRALDSGATRVVVGIGGSATNDGGAGLAQALGYRLLDEAGCEIEPGGGALDRLDRIDRSAVDPRIGRVEIAVACDVDNPLCGPDGASAVYGPQKGATADQVARLDRNLALLAAIVRRDLGVDVLNLPGGGAAGGLGAGLVAFARGKLQPGIRLVINAVNLPDRLEGADLCWTGEGAIDASSMSGKTISGVARLARSLGVPTLALAGSIGPGADGLLGLGVDAYFSACPGPISLDQAMTRAAEYIERAAEQAMRGFMAGRRATARGPISGRG